jgi:hypothetical protein
VGRMIGGHQGFPRQVPLQPFTHRRELALQSMTDKRQF